MQISLLRLFERGMGDEQTLELRTVIIAHFPEQLLAQTLQNKVPDYALPTLTSEQVKLLRLFECRLSDEQELELRCALVAHFSSQLQEEVKRISDERGYTADDIERMLQEPS